MSISHRRPVRSIVKKALSLQSLLSVVVALCLYSAICHYVLRPPLLYVQEHASSCAILSTDVCDPIRISIKESIENAKSSIVLIIYSLSDKKIIAALQGAAERGVDVSVVYDLGESPDVDFLLGKKVKCYPRHNRGLMHHKLLAIDHSFVWMGSANFTTSSFIQQGNLVVALNSPAVAHHIEMLADSLIHSVKFQKPPLNVSLADQNVTLFFHPTHGDISLRTLIDRIDNATKRVFVAMFTFTHPQLVAAISRAKKRGVDVRVIFDQDSARAASRKTFIQCRREGILSGIRTKQGLLHYKTAVIDDCLIAGSANWTLAGFSANNDTLLIIDPLTSAQQYWVDRWWSVVEQRSTILRK